METSASFEARSAPFALLDCEGFMRSNKFIISVVVIVMLACAIIAYFFPYHPMIPFDRSRWKEAEGEFEWIIRR